MSINVLPCKKLRDKWKSCWISVDDSVIKPPFVAAYKLNIDAPENICAKIHATADERYILYLDDAILGRGSERGDKENWFYETYELNLSKGKHILWAKVWTLGNISPFAQMSVKHGFILEPEDENYLEILGSGLAHWESRKLEGYDFIYPHLAGVTGANISFDSRKDNCNLDEKWASAKVMESGINKAVSNNYNYAEERLLTPSQLPPMLFSRINNPKACYVSSEDIFEGGQFAVGKQNPENAACKNWNATLNERIDLHIPPHTAQRILIDLGNYYCAYPKIIVSGGKNSIIRIFWAEALYEKTIKDSKRVPKGNRDIVDGKYFCGAGDVFIANGEKEKTFKPLWWRAGRYVEIGVKTFDEELTVNELCFNETRYPLEINFSFESDSDKLNSIIPPALRSLEMCMHETYMDCPYYEQLMYIGDTRIQALVNCIVSCDNRLAAKSLRLIDDSRLSSGLTPSRYPSRYLQKIPPFSLFFAAMIYDQALWRNNRNLIVELIPGMRAVIDFFIAHIEDGLLKTPFGWNFFDWVPEWGKGCPPVSDDAVSGPLNCLFAMVLDMAAKLEKEFGDIELSLRAFRIKKELKTKINAVFWNSEIGLYSDDSNKKHYSEHTQALAILSDVIDVKNAPELLVNMDAIQNIAQTSIYFSHYLFEAFYKAQMPDLIYKRLGLWFELSRKGLKTVYEEPEPSRSDCHAWGSHVIYHIFSSIMGVRPIDIGFKKIEIKPCLNLIKKACFELPHPNGKIKVNYCVDEKYFIAKIFLPEALEGRCICGEEVFPMRSGENNIRTNI